MTRPENEVAWLHSQSNEPPQNAGRFKGRIPQVSGLTMVGRNEQESINTGYKELAAAIRECIHPRYIARDCEELFSRMVFNIFVTNDDDHLRNHAFLYDTIVGGWRLSPLYDVVPRPMVAQERLLHLGVGNQGRLGTLDNAMSEHSAFIPDRPNTLAAIRRVWGAVREWQKGFEEMGATLSLIKTMHSAIRKLDEIASGALVKDSRAA